MSATTAERPMPLCCCRTHKAVNGRELSLSTEGVKCRIVESCRAEVSSKILKITAHLTGWIILALILRLFFCLISVFCNF